MRSFLLTATLLIVFLQVALVSYAQKPLPDYVSTQARVNSAGIECETGSATALLDANGVSARLFNTGSLFWRDGAPQYEVPKGEGINSLFTANFWIAGWHNGTELRAVGSTYGPYEFWPGPLDANGDPPADCSLYDRIYVVSGTDIEAYDQASTATQDMLDWPWDLGAPVEDGDGNPDNYNLVDGDRPAILGDQAAWWIMNDAAGFHGYTEGAALPVQVEVLAYAFSDPTPLQLATFYKLRVTYKGSEPLTDAFLGFWQDPDLGNGGDDFMGSASLLSLAFTYNANETDHYYGFPPPSMGVAVLQGPPAAADGVDNDRDGQIDESDERAGFYAFVSRFNWSGEWIYTDLAGRQRNGEPIRIGGDGTSSTGLVTTYMYSGNPPDFWSMENVDAEGGPLWDGDRRGVSSVGPVTFEPGDVKEYDFAIVWSRGDDRLGSVARLKQDVQRVHALFAQGFGDDTASAPAASPVLWAPADGAEGLPVSFDFVWSEVEFATRYDFELSTSSDFSSLAEEQTVVGATKASVMELAVSGGTTLYWRVRGVNSAGVGPWSETSSLTVSGEALTGGVSGIYILDGNPGFVEVAGASGFDPCGPMAVSTFGCTEIGGNYVYESANGDSTYVMAHQGSEGPEGTLEDFAPNDFEIRFTESGSYGINLFDTFEHYWLPFEVWDIGDVAPFTQNDAADDIQLIPVIFSESESDGRFAYGHAESPFWPGEFNGATDWAYGFYSTSTYEEWEAVVRDSVEAAGGVWVCEGCPHESLIDLDRWRPIQRIIFDDLTGDPSVLYPGVGTVIRFYTNTPQAPSAPVLTSPAAGSSVSGTFVLWWQSFPGEFDVHIALEAEFQRIVVQETTGADRLRVTSLPSSGTYYWRVRLTDENGFTSDWSDASSFDFVSSTGTDADETPYRFALGQNYPNPFNPTTTISYQLPQTQKVHLAVYDVLGREVEVLVSRVEGPGAYRVRVDARRLASGVYFYRLRAGDDVATERMVVIK